MPLQNVTVISSIEQPRLNAAKVLERVFVITLETSLGNVGQLVIPVKKYETMTNDELAQAIAEKAMMLDRPQLL